MQGLNKCFFCDILTLYKYRGLNNKPYRWELEMGKQMREHVFKKMLGGGAMGRVAKRVVVCFATAAMCVAGLMAVPSAQAFAAEKAAQVPGGGKVAVDAQTADSVDSILKNSTEYIGRIWTDKTVSADSISVSNLEQPVSKSGDSDFLVGLSALSSTSNETKTTTTSVPLDIVMVLDTSGSMSNDMGTGTVEIEETVSDPSRPSRLTSEKTKTDYYIKKEDGTTHPVYAVAVKRLGRWRFDHWEADGQTVSPNKWDKNFAQFYQKVRRSPNRMDALKLATKNFIAKTAEANASMPAGEQHRISIVTYESEAHTKKGLTDVSGASVTDLTNVIDGLEANGGTRADLGFANAKTVLDGASRPNAKKVVLFFTDGTPGMSGWDDNVASSAIATACAMKAEDTLVYSVGVLDGAKPEVDPEQSRKNEDKFMHAVSSNYKDATYENVASSWWENPKYEWNFGPRTPKSEYYLSADKPEKLDEVFQKIQSSITSSHSYPTEIEGVKPSNGGFITFKDELGPFMKVADVNSIVLGSKEYTQKTTKKVDDTTTYTFEGIVTDDQVIEAGSMSDINITVQHGTLNKEGDTVTVKIPASLIPVRKFHIDQTKKTLTVDNSSPIRVFYSVALKRGDEGLDLSHPQGDGPRQFTQDEMAKYVKDGKVSFYSNAWTPNEPGDTTATYSPAHGNSYYYFTQVTPIYEGATGETPARVLENGKTYHYKWTYLEKTGQGDTFAEKTKNVTFNGSNVIDSVKNSVEQTENGGIAFKAGTPRYAYITGLTHNKDANTTGTGEAVINQHWADQAGELPKDVVTSLGNNGKISMSLPGKLMVHKTAQAADGFTAPKNQSFAFNITVDGVNGTYDARVFGRTGNPVGDMFKCTFTNGKATHSIKDGETLVIYGLPAGAAYEVSEDSDKMPAGFTLTSIDGKPATDDPATHKVAGAISFAIKQGHDFANTYKAAPAELSASDFVSWSKDFDKNWDIVKNAQFDIVLKGSKGAPMPKGATTPADGISQVKATASKGKTSGEFGAITFNKPGTYEYGVVEAIPQTGKLPGVGYSHAAYKVTVKVAVDGKDASKLVATATVVRTKNDAGDAVGGAKGEPVANRVAAFKNTFNADSSAAAPAAEKDYVDNSGNKPLDACGFQFNIKPVKQDGSVDEAAPFYKDVNRADGKTVDVLTSSVTFPVVTFGQETIGKTYYYDLREVIPAGDADGMAYDSTVYRATVKVSTENVDGAPRVKVDATYNKLTADGQMGEAVNGVPVFHNVYTPEPVVVPGGEGDVPGTPDNAAIKVTKTLKGRDSLQGESFEFAMSGWDDSTKAALKSGAIAFVGTGASADGASATASVADLTNGVAKRVAFGGLKATKPGTYKFSVKENAPVNGNGMSYDSTLHIVTVEVTDNNGKLAAKVSYENKAEAAAFTNTYEASGSLATSGVKLSVSKTLNGRGMKAGEFSFAIAGVDGVGTTAEQANKKLAKSDTSFSVETAALAGKPSFMRNKLAGMKFNQNEVGKTFSYQISESKPSADKLLPGVTYDQSVFQLNITVHDNGKGALYETGELRRVKDATGQAVVDSAPQTFDGSNGVDTVTAGFVNNYQAAPVAPEFSDIVDGTFKKKLTGRAWTAGDSFEFTLVPVSDAPMPAGVTELKTTVTNGNVAQDTVEFRFNGQVTYDHAGTYNYNVTETNGGQRINGVYYDNHTATLVVTVSDKGNGQLEAKAVVENALFTNEYTADGATLDQAAFAGWKKSFAEWEILPTAEFKIELRNQTVNAPMPDGAVAVEGQDGVKSLVATATKGAPEGTFGAVEFTAPGEYVYTVSERQGAEPGVSYSGETYTVTVTVEDNGQGALVATSKVVKNSKANGKATKAADAEVAGGVAAFTNGFNAKQANVVLKAHKNFVDNSGKKDLASCGFQFNIKPEGDAPFYKDADRKAGMNVDVTAPDVTFPQIAFDKTNIGHTYTYLITEVQPADKLHGMTYDATKYRATVAVDKKKADDGTMAVVATVTYKKDGAESETVTVPAFTNTYTPDEAVVPGGSDGKPAEGGIAVTKTLIGRDSLKDESFRFTLVPAGATVDAVKAGIVKLGDSGAPQLTASVSDLKKGVAAPVVFGESISFSKPGEYTFDIAETAGAAAGMTYDNHHAIATVSVADEAGKLKAAVSIKDPVFTNEYKAASVVVTPAELGEGATFHKVLKGRDWLGTDAFEFSIKAVGDNASKAPAFEKQSVTLEGQKAADGQVVDFDFGRAEFTEAGTYTYEVSETKGSIAGVTYAKDPRKLVVKVTDPGDGKLVATVEADGDDNTFTNTYKAGGTDHVDISKATEGDAQLVKVLKGRDWKAGDGFEFSIEATGDNKADAPMPAPATVRVSSEDAASGTKVPFAFDKVSFDKAGTYTYEVRETKGSIAGVTYDGHTATITVKVTDDGLGKLKAAVSVDKPDFVNKYTAVAPTPEAGQSNVTFTKKLVGRDWHNGETFSFTMTGEDGAPMPEGSSNGTKTVKAEKPSSGNTAKFGFGPITYTFADVENAPQHTKQFVYTIRENIPAEGDRAPHLTYDNREVKLYVTVKDYGDGLLGVSSNVENRAVDATFVNTYKAELDFTKVANGAGLTAHKVLSGRDMTAGQFGISVAATGDNAAEAADKLGIAEGDKGTQFAVPAGANGQDVAVDLLAHAKDKGGMKFTQDDLNKTFTYRIWESQGGDDGYVNDAGSYTVTFTPELSGKDELQVKVTRTATDGAHAQGPNEITVSSQGAAEGIRADFLNAYKAEGNAQNGNGSIALAAAKKLSGRPLQAGEFSFKRALVNAKTGQVEDVFAREAKNDAAGKIDFGTITFNSDELNKLAAEGKIGRTVDAANGNATWTIKMRAWELTDGLPAGVSAVDDHVDFTIAVTDNGDGTLSKPQIGPKDVKLEFINNYTAGGVDPDGKPTDGKTSLALKGSKTLKTTDGGLQQSEIAGKFSFTLAPETEGAPMPAKATVTNDAAGNVDFGVIEFTLDNLNAHLVEPAARSGQSRSFDYVYKVTESGSLPGVTNDTAATKTVTIAVTDDGKGVLSAAVKDVAAGQPAFAFVNTYAISEGGKPSVSPTDNGEGRFSVTKHLEGRELQAGEFSFELVENATGKVVAEGVNDAEGNVELGKIKFTEPGTRTFTLRERKGDKGGVTYSTVEYAVTAQAVDNHMGALEVTFTVRDAAGKEVKDLIFTNTYKADPTSLQINAVKVLTGEGAKLGSGQFEFVIENTDSKRTEITKAHNGEAVNNAAPVEFQSIPLDKAGDYHLTMREVKGKDAQIVYDDSVVDITFTVVDDQNGKLVVKDNAVKYAVDGKPVEQPVFRNEFHAIVDGLPLGPGHIDAMDLKPAQKHEPAKKPADKNKLVQTGDNAGIGIALVAAAGVAVLGGGLLIKRRSNR